MVTVWLMMLQRLNADATLREAVSWLYSGFVQPLLEAHKRVVEATVSQNTGAYSQARKNLPREVAEAIADHMFERLTAREPVEPQPIWLLDGSSLSLAPTPELKRAFPPAHNQHGKSHWPIARVVTAHDVRTGLAVRPVWGPMYGPEAVSEQSLAFPLLERLSPGLVINDRNFGVFQIAYQAHQLGHQVLTRLTKARARALLKGELTPGLDVPIVWQPSRHDRKAHPELPQDARVKGRLVVCRVAGQKQPLYLFTTWDAPAPQVVELYARRWGIELDLGSLKGVLDMNELRSKTTAMVEKELILAIAAYNLVQSVRAVAARSVGIEPRRLSFTGTWVYVKAYLGKLLQPSSPQEFLQDFTKMIQAVSSMKLPNRSKPRSYPRKIWLRRRSFPTHRTEK